MALNDRAIKKLPRGRHTDSRGLYLLVGAPRTDKQGADTTVRTWQFKKRGVWRPIGLWPQWGCAAARNRAAELAVQDNQGRPMGLTLKDAFKKWRDMKGTRAAATFDWHKRTFKNHFCNGADVEDDPGKPKPKSVGWRDRELTKISRTDIDHRHGQIVRKAGPMAARNAVIAFAVWWKQARRLDPMLPECPTVAVDLHPQRERDRSELYARLDDWHAALALLRSDLRRELYLFGILTGLRRDNLRMARWEHIRGDLLHVPTPKRAKGKGYSPFDLPLTDAHLEVLERLRRIGAGLAPNSPWIFPGTKGDALLNVRLSAAEAVAWREAEAPEFTTHDLRACFMAAMVEAKVHPYTMALLVNHRIPGIAARYIPRQMELREAMTDTVAVLMSAFGSERLLLPPPVGMIETSLPGPR